MDGMGRTSTGQCRAVSGVRAASFWNFPIKRGDRNAESLGDALRRTLRNCKEGTRFPLRDFVELSLCSTRPALRARRGKTCRRKFADDAALELRKGTADMEEEPAAGRRRVHRFCHGLEADTFAVEQLDRFDELLDAAGQPVEFSYNQHVALSHVIKGAGELRSVALGAGGRLGEDPLAAGRLQRIDQPCNVPNPLTTRSRPHMADCVEEHD